MAMTPPAAPLTGTAHAALHGDGARPVRLTLPGIRALHRRLVDLADFDIGYPNAVDLDLSPLERFWDVTLNNVGYPFAPAHGFSGHTLGLEAALITELAQLFRGPADDVTGHVTSGSTEGVRVALLQARRRFNRRLMLYASSAAHTCVRKLAEELCMPLTIIPATAGGEMDYPALAAAAAEHPRRAAVVVATAGTTMAEAVDSVPHIHHALDTAGVPTQRRFVHADAALAGPFLAVLDPSARPGFDLADGADSLNISGHKGFGIPTPCGAVLLRASSCPKPNLTLTYTGAPDVTPAGSRSGHTPLMLLFALQQFGRDGLHRRAQACREQAASLVRQLEAADVPAWRHRLAFTVVVPRPSDAFLRRWPLPVEGAWSHVICMPGKPAETYERFAAEYVTDLRHNATEQPAAASSDELNTRAVAC